MRPGSGKYLGMLEKITVLPVPVGRAISWRVTPWAYVLWLAASASCWYGLRPTVYKGQAAFSGLCLGALLLLWSLGRGVCSFGGIDLRRGRGQFFGQGMGSQAEFHDGLCVRQASRAEAVGGLIVAHRLARPIVPRSGGLALIVTGVSQGALDLFDAPRAQAYFRPGRLTAGGCFP